MSKKAWVVAGGALVVIALAGLANAASVTRVTGGGQYFTDGAGADDTLTFEVQQTDTGATFGEVEFDPTNSQTGQTIRADRFHGDVECAVINVSEGTATFGGRIETAPPQGETDEPRFFEIFLKDNPPSGDDDDFIILDQNDDNGDCDNDFGDSGPDLFRGEAQITTNGSARP